MKHHLILSMFYYTYILSKFISAINKGSDGMLLFSIMGMFNGIVLIFPLYITED